MSLVDRDDGTRAVLCDVCFEEIDEDQQLSVATFIDNAGKMWFAHDGACWGAVIDEAMHR